MDSGTRKRGKYQQEETHVDSSNDIDEDSAVAVDIPPKKRRRKTNSNSNDNKHVPNKDISGQLSSTSNSMTMSTDDKNNCNQSPNKETQIQTKAQCIEMYKVT